MNALLLLALLASSSRAGVVAPIETGVAPAGPSVTVVPIGAAVGGRLIAPLFGAGLGRLGGLPLLPAPVPGLVGPALYFIGDVPKAAEASPVPGAARAEPAPASVRRDRAGEKTPVLPAKPASGGLSLALPHDRQEAAAAPANGLSPAQLEKGAGLGRSFFDQSADKDRGTLAGAAAERPSAFVAATILDGGAFGSGLGSAGRLAPPDAEDALGAGHGPRREAVFDASQGEVLRDAVAAAPGSAAPGGAVAFLRSAAPNGDLAASLGAPRAALLEFPGAPPLALDLSRSGLIVRVRSALHGVISPAGSEALAAKLVLPGASTAWLERGAMLEAFSVAHAYADGVAAQSAAAVQPRAAVVSRVAASAVPPAPVSKSSPAPLWWAWLALPLLAAAAYRAF